MSRSSLIKLIHVARRDLQLDDDTYHAFKTLPQRNFLLRGGIKE